MYAYCNNNSVIFYDPSGTFCAYNLMESDSGKLSDKLKAQYVIPFQQKYSRNNWANSSVEEKKQLLEQHMNEIATALNVTVVPNINYYNANPKEVGYISWGSYVHDSRTININEYLIENWSSEDSYFLLSIVRHETRHAYQNNAIIGMDIYGYDSPYSETYSTLVAWDYNLRNYISSSMGWDAYYDQPVEVDARAFALQPDPRGR